MDSNATDNGNPSALLAELVRHGKQLCKAVKAEDQLLILSGCDRVRADIDCVRECKSTSPDLLEDLVLLEDCIVAVNRKWEPSLLDIRYYDPELTRSLRERVSYMESEYVTPKKPAENSEGELKVSHSPDFTSVNWYGKRYRFAKGNQARTVSVLWEAWEKGEHGLSQETVGERINSTAGRFEMRKTFRSKNTSGRFELHPAWGTMIQNDGKGCYRLAL